MSEWYQKVHTDDTDYTNDDLEQAIKTAVERYRLDDPTRSLLGVAAVRAVVEWMADNGYMVVRADTDKPLLRLRLSGNPIVDDPRRSVWERFQWEASLLWARGTLPSADEIADAMTAALVEVGKEDTWPPTN